MRVIYIDIRQLKGKIKPDETIIKVKVGEQEQKIALEYQVVGFGKRRFFRCNCCSKRVERLYYKNECWRCFKCHGINPYKGIMNNTKGGYDEIAYRMKRYAQKHDIEFEFPFRFYDFKDDCRFGKKVFMRHLKVLQGLESMRFQAISFGITFNSSDFKLVISGKHQLMEKTTIFELANNIYDWKTGKQIQIPENQVKSFVKS